MNKLFKIIFSIFLITNLYSQEIKIVETFGQCEILKVSQNKKLWEICKEFDALNTKDRIRTGQNSFVTLIYDESKFTIKENSIIELENWTENGVNFRVIKGKLRGIVKNLLAKNKIVFIKTKTAISKVKGTDFAIHILEDKTALYVFEGEVEVANINTPDLFNSVLSGKMASVPLNSVPSISEIPEEIYNEYNIQRVIETAKPDKPVQVEYAVKTPQVSPVIEPAKSPEVSNPKETAIEPKKTEQPQQAPLPEKKETSKEEPKKEEKKEPWCPDPKLEFNINFDFQYLNINKKGYGLVAFIPEFGICKIGFGFYLPIIILSPRDFLYSKRWYNHNEWDFASPSDSLHDFIIKFIYVRYGKKGEPIYIRIGSLPSVTFGNGFIMNDYSNMLDFPKIRRIGLEFSFIFKNLVGLEGMTSDLSKNEITGYRVFVLPFGIQQMGILSKLQIGLSLISDTKAIDKNTKVINWGFDAGLPILETPLINLRYGIDWATYSVYAPNYLGKDEWVGSKNYGFATGFRGNLAFFIFRAEYRYLLDGYITEYFDNFYEIERKSKFLSLISMYTRPGSSLNGYLVSAGTKLGKAGELGFIFQEYYNKEIRNKASLYLTLEKGVIPYGYGTLSYNKVNVVGLTGNRSLFGNLYDENTILTFDGGIKLFLVVYLKVYYQRTFERDPSTGKLINKETYSTGITFGF